MTDLILALALLALVAVLGRRTTRTARRTKTPQKAPQTKQDEDAKASRAPYYFWLGLAGGLIVVVILAVLGLSALSPEKSLPGVDAGFPKLPSTPAEMWWLLISFLGGTTIAILLRTKGTQPHLVAAAVLGIFTVFIIGLAIIQGKASSQKAAPMQQATSTPVPSRPQQLEHGGEFVRPGYIVYVAHRGLEWGKQRKVFIPPFGYRFETSFESKEHCGLEALVNDSIVVPNAHTELNMNKFVPRGGGVRSIRYRPTDCPTVILRVKVEKIGSTPILSQ